MDLSGSYGRCLAKELDLLASVCVGCYEGFMCIDLLPVSDFCVSLGKGCVGFLTIWQDW